MPPGLRSCACGDAPRRPEESPIHGQLTKLDRSHHELSFGTPAPLDAMPLAQSRFVIRHGGIPRRICAQRRPRALVRRPTHVEDWHCHSSAADDALAEARAQCVEHIVVDQVGDLLPPSVKVRVRCATLALVPRAAYAKRATTPAGAFCDRAGDRRGAAAQGSTRLLVGLNCQRSRRCVREARHAIASPRADLDETLARKNARQHGVHRLRRADRTDVERRRREARAVDCASGGRRPPQRSTQRRRPRRRHCSHSERATYRKFACYMCMHTHMHMYMYM